MNISITEQERLLIYACIQLKIIEFKQDFLFLKRLGHNTVVLEKNLTILMSIKEKLKEVEDNEKMDQ